MTTTNKLTSGMMLIAFAVTSFLPARVTLAEVARSTRISSAVAQYSLAKTGYAKDGNFERFLDSLSQKSLSEFEKYALMSRWEKGTILPVIEERNGDFVLISEGRTARVTIVDASNGDYLLNGERFHYDKKRSLMQNIRVIEEILGDSRSLSMQVWEFFVPSAHAFLDNPLVLALLAGLIVYGLTSKKDNAAEQTAPEPRPHPRGGENRH